MWTALEDRSIPSLTVSSGLGSPLRTFFDVLSLAARERLRPRLLPALRAYSSLQAKQTPRKALSLRDNAAGRDELFCRSSKTRHVTETKTGQISRSEPYWLRVLYHPTMAGLGVLDEDTQPAFANSLGCADRPVSAKAEKVAAELSWPLTFARVSARRMKSRPGPYARRVKIKRQPIPHSLGHALW